MALIARDEEGRIERCLRSVEALAPQTVVVDTGSTDRTREIARGLGAEVHRIDWKDDFSHARNESLRHVRGEWVLWLDADEELEPEGVGPLRALLARSEVAAAHLRIDNRVGGKTVPFLAPRLWRHHPAVRFRDPVHEQVLWSILPVAEKEGRRVVEAPEVGILHDGYSAGRVAGRRKEERNLKLLEKSLRRRPGHPRFLFHYACALRDARRFEEAVACFRRWEESAWGLPRSEDHWVRLGFACYASCLIELGAYAEALRIADLALAGRDESRSLRVYRAQALQRLGRNREAFEELGRAGGTERSVTGAPEAVDFQPPLVPTLIAEVYGALGREQEALNLFLKELKRRPEDPSPRFGLARLHLSRENLAGAVREYRAIVDVDPEDVGALSCLSQLEIVRRRPEEATRHLERARALAPGRVDLTRLLGEAYLLAGRLEEARAVWEAEAGHPEVDACRLLFSIPEGRCRLEKLDPQVVSRLQGLVGLARKILTFAEPESAAVRAFGDCASALRSTPVLRPLYDELHRLLGGKSQANAETRTF